MVLYSVCMCDWTGTLLFSMGMRVQCLVCLILSPLREKTYSSFYTEHNFSYLIHTFAV